jgi:hypothetical protein
MVSHTFSSERLNLRINAHVAYHCTEDMNISQEAALLDCRIFSPKKHTIRSLKNKQASSTLQ